MDVKLGEKPDYDAERDAIHVPVIPMVAGETLNPGEWVELGEDSWGDKVAKRSHGNGIAIVDPFLPGPVQSGDMVWLLPKPGLVDKVKHNWSVPEFPDSTETYYDECKGCY